MVAGNCGFSIAPVRPEGVELLAHTLQHVEDMSFDTLLAGVPWDRFESFADYLDAVEQRGVDLNFACYVGHTAVRLFVMGDDAYERPATPDELVAMQSVVRSALEHGAIGFASSAASTHNGDRGRPVPSRVSDLDELRFLLAPLGELGRGVVALLPGTEISQDEVFRLQEEIGRPITWTALIANRGTDGHRNIVEANDEARSRGVDVWPQVACRPIIFQTTMAAPFTFNTLPSFSRLMGTSLDDRMAAYRDPKWRDEAWAELSGGRRSLVRWETVKVSESDAHPELVGRSVVELATERQVSPLDVVIDLSLTERLETRFQSELANNDPNGIAWLLPRDNLLFGLADSGAHVSQLCDACFATDILGTWVREREALTLERAVHKLSGEPASVYGLVDRGTVEVGKSADLVVFDPDTVGTGPIRRLRDFPAEGDRLTADAPLGIHHVYVNGIAIRSDERTVTHSDGRRPGVVLRG